LRFRPRFAQKIATGVIQLPWAWYLSWLVPLSTSSLGLYSRRYSIFSALRYFFRCYSSRATVPPGIRPGPSDPFCYNHPPFRIRRPVESSNQLKYHQDLLFWPHPIRLVLTVPYTTSVRSVPTVPVPGICAHTRPPTYRWHLRPRARAHARILMPVCGVKPRESALIPL